ncbi:MAG: DUF2778 domain-containing protein [Pseudomonadota bacterium]
MQEIEQQKHVGPERPKLQRKFPLRTFGIVFVMAALAFGLLVYGPVLTSSGDRVAVSQQDQRVLALAAPAALAPAKPQTAVGAPASIHDPNKPVSAAPVATGIGTSPLQSERFADDRAFLTTSAALNNERSKKIAKLKLAVKLAHLRFAQHLAIARAERVEAAAQLALAQPALVEPLVAVRVPGTKPPAPVRSAAVRTKPDAGISQTPAPVLAYATPGIPEEEGKSGFGGLGKIFNGLKGGLPGRGSGIAVYDISAAVVHMPDGSKLEAHSGIGHRKDNPKYSHVRNLGPTPPNIYDLRMRERRFHGVEAIRMLPRDLAAMKGRDGMLAHSPLLRRSNGSHGCVAFKDYNKFLKAFKAGKVKKIIVVPSMEKLPKYMAKLNRGTDA